MVDICAQGKWKLSKYVDIMFKKQVFYFILAYDLDLDS